ncbi:MAG: hypothetical protein H7138_08860 [Myxococcales bacterium]|nr:hypothetical protein [Myxococcales bacterium]
MKTCCWLIWVVGLAACAVDAPPAPVVVVASTPASAEACSSGGVIVASGTDDNGNRMLDDDEVVSRLVVCNAPPVVQPTLPTLVRLVAEPAGAHCTLDGTAVQSGPDRNANSVLDEDEIVHIDYACGEVLLTRLAPAPGDARCIAGGVAFLAGRDRDRDGTLGDDEVEQREVTCGDVLARDVAIHDAADVAALSQVAVITGSLVVSGTTLTELALPLLVQVRGAIEIRGNAALARVTLRELRSVDGQLALTLDPALTTIDVPKLRRVGGLVVDGATALRALGELAALPEVAGDVRISNNAVLGSIDLTIGRIGRGLTIDGNAQLTGVVLALPGTLGALQIASNPRLARLELGGAASRLTEVGGVTVSSNAALERIALDADELEAIVILDNPALAEIAVSSTRVVDDVLLNGNGDVRLAFSARAPDAFTIGGSLRVSGPVVEIRSTRPLIVNRDCTIDRTHLTAFGPGQVSQVGGALVLSGNSRLVDIETIAVGLSLVVQRNHTLTHLDFTFGEQLHGELLVEDNASLEIARFDGLHRVVGYVTIDRNPSLKTVLVPQLEEVTGALVFLRNASLGQLELANLHHVGGLSVGSCDSLIELVFPALTQVDIFSVTILRNLELLHVRFPVLTSADFNVLGNPRLAACEVDAMLARITGDHDQRFNDETAVCTP